MALDECCEDIDTVDECSEESLMEDSTQVEHIVHTVTLKEVGTDDVEDSALLWHFVDMVDSCSEGTLLCELDLLLAHRFWPSIEEEANSNSRTLTSQASIR